MKEMKRKMKKSLFEMKSSWNFLSRLPVYKKKVRDSHYHTHYANYGHTVAST